MNKADKDESKEPTSISIQICINKTGEYYGIGVGNGINISQSFSIRAPGFEEAVQIMKRFSDLLQSVADEFPPPPETEEEKRKRKGLYA